MSKVENSKTLFLDFEFSRVVERDVNLVSCVTFDGNETKKFWLHNSNFNQDLLKEYLQKFDRFVAYSAIAECRCFLTLGLDPLKYKWVDLFLEYRCLSNHSDELNYGEQLVEGKVKKVSKPRAKWEKSDSDEAGFKPTHSLAEATFKLLGVIRDTEHKTAMRNLVISDPEKFSDDEMLAILDYGVDDVKDLLPMYKVMKDKYLKRDLRLTGNKLLFEMQLRGRYSAHTAIMERNGYPIDVRKTKNFSNSVGAIMYDCQKEINSLFPTIQPFKWDRKLQKFKWDQKATRAWIRTLDKKILERWRMTDGGKKEKPDLSLAMEAFTDFFDFKHDYPKDNFGAQMVRFLKLKQNLFGFVSSPDKKRKSFWDYVGSDGMVRPYMNIYGAQTSRTQPGTGFMFLKPAWMRALVVPPKGKAMAGIDFGSQEFLLSALLSNDLEMIEAYMSGDPYLAFGKLRGVIPQDGTKASHKIEREMCKSSVLGISYAMTKYGLAIKMTADTGKICTEDEAQEWINEFYNAFPDLAEYKKDIEDQYEEDGFIKLQCGWYLWGDNENPRSVGNFPVQGCIHGDTRVPTKEFGYQRIKDLSGMQDITVWDGLKWSKADCIPSGKKKEVEIVFRDNHKITVSPDHRFLCVNPKTGAEKWKRPEEFRKVEFIRRSIEVAAWSSFIPFPEFVGKAKNSKNGSLNDKMNMLDLGILLGRLCSDGTCDKGRGMHWTVAEHEKEILPLLLGLVGQIGSPTLKVIKRDKKLPLYQINLYDHGIETQIITENLCYSMESKTLWSDSELLRGFLIGYMDGDGGICCTDGIKITFGKGESKKKYAMEMQKAFFAFGIESRLHFYSYRTDLAISSKDREKFKKIFYFLNPKKQKRLLEIPERKRNSIKLKDISTVKSVIFKESTCEMFDIANCPDQKFSFEGIVSHNCGGSIMRKAVDLAVERGVQVVKTLHDAIYIIYDIGDEKQIIKLRDAMIEAMGFYFTGRLKEMAMKIKLDPFAWSPDYSEGEMDVQGWKVPTSPLYIDERAIGEYKQFSKYFEDSDADLL